MGKRNRDVNIRKEQFDELLAANSKHLAVDPENEKYSVLCLVCCNAEGASQRIALGNSQYSLANVIDHCTRKCHRDKLSVLNASLTDEGEPRIPDFVNTSVPKKECARPVSNFFAVIQKGRTYPKGGVSPEKSTPLAISAPPAAGALVVSGGDQSTAVAASGEVRVFTCCDRTCDVCIHLRCGSRTNDLYL